MLYEFLELRSFKMKNVVLAVVLFALMAVGVYAQSESDFQAYVEGKSILIVRYTGSTTDVKIPEKIKNLPVTKIDRAFLNNKNITSVTIPDSVISIGEMAFEGCSNLISVTIGNSVTSIGRMAFSGCTSLTSVIIGNSVTSIGVEAFKGCTSLSSVTIPNSITSIGVTAFSGCGLTSVTIPASVTSIGHGAFGNCQKLTSVIIPSSVTSIGNIAFVNCRSLTSITIPASVTSIGNQAFSGCGLTSVTFQGTINLEDTNDPDLSVFDGDLDKKYLAGGIGTYKRPNSNRRSSWTKQ
jgi:hypothetical protein